MTDDLFRRLERRPFERDLNDLREMDREIAPHPFVMKVTNKAEPSTATAKVDPDGLHATAGNLGPTNVAIDTDGVIVRDGSAVERVRLGALGGGDYGLRITNPAGTVIIDGTSNVFKIIATGTLVTASFTNPANPGSSATADVSTGLAYAPASMWYTNLNSGEAHPMPRLVIGNNGVPLDWYTSWVQDLGSGSTRAKVEAASSRASGTTPSKTHRYYLLKEIAF